MLKANRDTPTISEKQGGYLGKREGTGRKVMFEIYEVMEDHLSFCVISSPFGQFVHICYKTFFILFLCISTYPCEVRITLLNRSTCDTVVKAFITKVTKEKLKTHTRFHHRSIHLWTIGCPIFSVTNSFRILIFHLPNLVHLFYQPFSDLFF